MQNYTKYTFNSTNEILVARLFDLGFDSFQELENSSEGYIRDDMITVELNASVNEIAKEYEEETRRSSRTKTGMKSGKQISNL